MSKVKVLITGGAGYIGSVLVRLLLERGYNVRVLDNLSFGGEPILDLLNRPDFEFIKGDIRDDNAVKKSLDGVEMVAHLASIVGDPACAVNPKLTKSVNIDGTINLYSQAENKGVKKFVFASTCSNYGKMKNPDSYVNEDSELAPVSLYAETKVFVEKYLLGQPRTNKCEPTCLRFSTVYGLSLRPRFDLTVNEFTKELVKGRELVVFGEQFWRPYCHVVDLARSVISVFEAPSSQTAFDVFNVGDTEENYQKQMIVNLIRDRIQDAKVKYVSKQEDPRDYRVSFEKIKNKLGFRITKRVPEGVDQIIKAVNDGFILNPDDPKYRNVN